MSAITRITEGRAGRSGQADGAGFAPVPVTFTVPVPPSVNECFRNLAGRGRVKTLKYDNWRAHAVTSIRGQHVIPVAGRVLVIFGVERSSNSADIDNRIKAMLDAIVEAKVIEDDSLVTGFAAAWLPATNGLAHVQIMPAQPISLEFHPSADRATGGWFMAQPQQGAA